MRLITLLSLLLLSVLCSCRSSKQQISTSTDTVSVKISELKQNRMADELLTLFTSSRIMDLSGIKVEFFAPDSLNKNVRPAPKSLTIEKAKSKEAAENKSHSISESSITDSIKKTAQSSKATNNNFSTDTSVFRPPDFSSLFWPLVVVALLIVAKIAVSKLRK